MPKTVEEALRNLKHFAMLLETKGEDAACDFAEMVLDDPIDHEEEETKPHLTVVE